MDEKPLYQQLVIGSLLQKPELAGAVDLSPQMFTSSTYQQAYQAIQSMQAQCQAIDLFTVAETLRAETAMDGWVEILAAAMQECYAPANVETYAESVRKDYRAAQAREVAATLVQTIDDEGQDAIDLAVRDLLALSAEQRNYEFSMKEVLTLAVDHIEVIQELDGKLPGVTSGLGGLDELLGGFHDGDLSVIAARPAMGKTAMLFNLALAGNTACGVISAEQPAVQVGTRLIAMKGRINAAKLRAAQLDDEDWKRVTVAIHHLNAMNLRVNDKSGITITDLVRQARAWKHNSKIKILYVDYIQRIKSSDPRLQRHEQVAEVVRGLKELARDLEIPVVALAQVNREVEKRANKRPSMGDIKDSGAIEQEADSVICLYRDEVYDKDSKDKGTAELDVVKNRHGPIGFVRVTWLAESMLFQDYITGIEQ